MENAEWSELKNVDPKNTTDLNRGVENTKLENMENWKTEELEYYKLEFYVDSTWIIFVC